MAESDKVAKGVLMADRNGQRSAEREERAQQAAKHLGLMRGAFAKEAQASADGAIIYEEGVGRELPLPEATAEATETRVVTSFIPEAIWRDGDGRVMVVDPASFTRPGGAYEDGAFGPEQILCSESDLYLVLTDLKEDYYDKNRDYRRGMLFTDRAVMCPEVIFLRGGSIKKADVIVVAEPLRARALENHRSERECDNALRGRIETFMRIAAANGCETLILGAFGCGRLGYDTAFVISIIKAWIDEHPGSIPKIVFAVPRAFVDAFRETFDPEEEEVVVAVAEEESDEEGDDWRSIDLPEGITLR